MLKAQEEIAKLKEANAELLKEKENLTKANTDLTDKNKTLTTENADLTDKITGLSKDKENLTKEKDNLTNQLNASQKQIKSLEQSQQALENEKTELKTEKERLTKEKTELTNKITELQRQANDLKNSQQVLENEKADLTNKITALSKDKENLTKANAELKTEKEKLTTDLSNAKNQVIQAKQEKDKLEQKYAPYKKLERLYEVFLEVKGCLNFGFVEKTHNAMDLIASVLSDSKYYLESLYNKASQELSDKRSDKGEKLAELFDLLFEYVKDNKFERLKKPDAYDSTCKKLYPEQNTSGKMQRVVLIGYTYDKKTTYYTIVDMGS
ncbi:hypothetical protein [Helicobacter pylori]|uniref:hypothetical protein n=1 Tax=Helicobacter pylori TaxID=210 RepID=UPI001F453FE4|nr:hypothetical protein [Helicobacter pylori]